MTTAGLSISGTLSIAGGIVIGQIGSLVLTLRAQKIEWPSVTLMSIMTAWELIPAVLMFRLAVPIEISKTPSGQWTVKRWTWSHRERSSRRIGDQLSWAVRLGVGHDR